MNTPKVKYIGPAHRMPKVRVGKNGKKRRVCIIRPTLRQLAAAFRGVNRAIRHELRLLKAGQLEGRYLQACRARKLKLQRHVEWLGRLKDQ